MNLEKLNEYVLVASKGNLHHFAKVHGFKYQSLRAKLKGSRKMDVDTLQKLADVLGLEVGYFFNNNF